MNSTEIRRGNIKQAVPFFGISDIGATPYVGTDPA